jgi:hypothetical protein
MRARSFDTILLQPGLWQDQARLAGGWRQDGDDECGIASFLQ